MSEKIIDLGGIVDPADFYGPAHVNFNHLTGKFPELKIVARGGTMKLIGSEEQIIRFEDRFGQLVGYYNRYGHISPEVLDQIFDTPVHSRSVSAAAGGNGSGVNGSGEGSVAEDVIVFGNNGTIVRARTENQRKLVELYGKNDLLFAVGPAGSGKTYTAIALAVRALKNKEVKRVILTRPAVESGEKLGFLPGDMKEKLDPYLQPLYDALNDMIPPKKLQDYMAEGIVQIAPLAFMRGRTLDNACVILDEAQNTILSQIKMFLTRMGRNAKFIVTGDATQVDLPNRQDSGLLPAIGMLRNIKGVGVVEFDRRDIVRHELVKQIVQAFDKHPIL
ncbi:PhoH family protein [uncultured Rikenella sp.]|uniref:PhoH family protein n=1 Tax=uncultured Rikenella sp. TaxID=368003 RepID=UPI00262CDC73|nr:PhoH family protein [uncultured Rikenella sp.]